MVLILLYLFVEGDQFGFVIFTETANCVLPLCDFAQLDMVELKRKIEATSAGGGTVLASGIEESPCPPLFYISFLFFFRMIFILFYFILYLLLFIEFPIQGCWRRRG
jgi:hypothetical protein